MPAHKANFILWGGAMLEHVPAEDENPPPIIGSTLLAYAETKEEVVEALKKDVYSTSGVWDWSKVQIWPFRSAVRSDLSTSQG